MLIMCLLSMFVCRSLADHVSMFISSRGRCETVRFHVGWHWITLEIWPANSCLLLKKHIFRAGCNQSINISKDHSVWTVYGQFSLICTCILFILCIFCTKSKQFQLSHCYTLSLCVPGGAFLQLQWVPWVLWVAMVLWVLRAVWVL